MGVEIVCAGSAHAAEWPSTEDGEYARRVLVPLMTEGVRPFIENVGAQQHAAIVDGAVLPITIPAPRGPEPESYVASPTTQYVDYARREVELEIRDRRSLRLLSVPLIGAASALARATRLDQAVLVNNWLVSTNLYPEIDLNAIRSLLSNLVERWPDRAIVFRSVNDALTRDLLEVLEAERGRAVFSRQVWILDPSRDLGFRRMKSFARDVAIAGRSSSHWRRVDEPADVDVDRIKALYDALYIEKYSSLNPQFTRRFVECAIAERWLDVHVLETGSRLDAVVGFFLRNGVMTTPFIGYDTERPQSDGLYRRISLKLIDEAAARGAVLHQSSGAAAFKRHRGAWPSIEYHVVFDRHLPVHRRAGWMVLGSIGRRILVPAVRRYNL